MRAAVRPARSLAHPLFVVAIAALALNDHVFKASGVLPEVSGKLSDVAGLLVAPLVLAWLCRVTTRRAWWASHLAVGVGFALIQVPVIAGALTATLPLHITPDPTDLLALPALLVSVFVFTGTRGASTAATLPARQARAHAAIGVVALVFCVASGGAFGDDAPPRYPFPPAGRLETDVFIRNHLAADIAVGVRVIRDDRTVDCDRLLREPEAILEGGDFGDEREWTIASRDAVPLWDRRGGGMTRDCYAVRLRARDSEWLISWRHGTPELREIPIRLEPHESPEAGAMRISEDPRAPPNVPSNVTVRRWED